jgi:glycopeptide antibiotics resistance protein
MVNYRRSRISARASFGAVALLVSLTLISAATLFPFNFHFRCLSITEYFKGFCFLPSSFTDFPDNIVLFLPFGWASAWLVAGNPAFLRRKMFWVASLGFGTSLLVETLQLFLPGRVSNVSDIISNTLGALLGAIFFRLWQNRVSCLRRFAAGLSPRYAWASLIIIFSLTTVFLWFLIWGMRISGWDRSYHLAVGNEMTGNRQWKGVVEDLIILDRFVSPAVSTEILNGRIPPALGRSILAHYSFGGDAPFLDNSGQSPSLLLAATNRVEQRNTGLLLGDRVWAASNIPATSIISRIGSTGQFTIAMTIISSDVAQYGPAPIFSISTDPDHRNITIGQDGDSLALSWRSPFQGENGQSSEILFPDVFRSRLPLRFSLTFDDQTVALHTSIPPQIRTIHLGPEAGLSALLHEDLTHFVYAGPNAFLLSAILLHLLCCIPFSVLLDDLIFRFGPIKKTALAVSFSLLLPLLQQLILFLLTGRQVLWSVALMDSSVILIGLFAMRSLRRMLLALTLRPKPVEFSPFTPILFQSRRTIPRNLKPGWRDAKTKNRAPAKPAIIT